MNWLKTSKSTEIFDSVENIWKKGPLMVYPRYGHCVVKLNDAVFVIGGRFKHLVVPFIEKLDLENMDQGFKVVGSLPEGSEVYFHACYVFKNSLYISGGVINLRNGEQSTHFVHTSQVLKSDDGVNYEKISGLNLKRAKHSMFESEGYLTVLGGGNGGNDQRIKSFSNIEIYDGSKWMVRRTNGVPVISNLVTVNL